MCVALTIGLHMSLSFYLEYEKGSARDLFLPGYVFAEAPYFCWLETWQGGFDEWKFNFNGSAPRLAWA